MRVCQEKDLEALSANTLNFERRCCIKSYCKELSHQSNEVFPFPVQDLKSENDWPVLGNPMGKPNTHRPSPWAKLPASVVAARANPAPPLPLTAVMTKAKAAPKIGSRRNSNSKASHASPKMRAKWSPAHTASSVMTTAAAAADLDPLPEPQQAVPVPDVPSTAHQDAKEESDAGEVTSQKSDEKKEDKHEKKEDKQEKEDKHEEKEDKHEEKTESNHQEDASSSQEPIPRQESSSEHGESRGDVDESASSAAVEPTPVPEIDEIARAKEAPQALCLCVGMYQWPSKDNQTPMPNVYLRVGSSVDVTKTQLIQVFGSSCRSIVKYCECNLHK